jgi:hypothetical protein
VIPPIYELIPYPGAAALYGHIYGNKMLVREYQYTLGKTAGQLCSKMGGRTASFQSGDEKKRINIPTKKEFDAAVASTGSWKEHLFFSAITFAKQHGIKTIQVLPADKVLAMVEPGVNQARLKASYDDFPKKLGFVRRKFAMDEKTPLLISKAFNPKDVWEMDVDKAYQKFGLDKIISVKNIK